LIREVDALWLRRTIQIEPRKVHCYLPFIYLQTASKWCLNFVPGGRNNWRRATSRAFRNILSEVAFVLHRFQINSYLFCLLVKMRSLQSQRPRRGARVCGNASVSGVTRGARRGRVAGYC
jgi:hypothetical protein